VSAVGDQAKRQAEPLASFESQKTTKIIRLFLQQHFMLS